eukprot:m.292464 g.292464  ORF g.292464 m.292464 type:complete len:479 (-) comp12633_c0_seq1:137-1573(-)
MEDEYYDEGDDGEYYEEEGEEVPTEVLCQARVLYPFESTCDVELDLDKDEIINVLRMDVGGGWWQGEIDGINGLFPSSYVEVVEAAPAGAGTPAMPAAAPRPTPTPRAATQRHAAGGAQHQLEEGPSWARSTEPFTVTVQTNKEKGSKFAGVKQFTTYGITTSNTSVVVSRRFKHFTWLHSRLSSLFPGISIPVIPDKQLQGRFDQSFIEQRRLRLELFLNRVALHPILGSSSVFRHFLTATDQKDWKSGKRQAESASNFLSNVGLPESGLPPNHESLVSEFSAFATWLEKQLSSVHKIAEDLQSHSANVIKDYSKLEQQLEKFDGGSSDRPSYTAWWDQEQHLERLLGGLSGLSAACQSIIAVSSDALEAEKVTFTETLREYVGMLKTFPSIIKAHESAWHEYKVQSSKDLPEAEATHERCEVVTGVALAEFKHFHESFVYDLAEMVRAHFTSQVEYHNKMAEIFQQQLEAFENTVA